MFNLLIFLLLFFMSLSFEFTELNSEKDIQTHYFNNYTKGGLGGEVIKVTNLNSSGPGSFRAALEAKGPRIIVFEAGGIIDLEMTNLKIENPFVTIAGQSAPHPGITIIKGGISVQTHNVIMKHIMVRPGDAGQSRGSGWEPDGISVYGENAHHILIDHCSVTWAVDENLSVSGPRLLGPEFTARNVTLSNNIIAEALHHSSHSEGKHSKGTLIHDNCQNIAVVGNLYAHNADRNPFFKINTTGIVVNNIIYNPGSAAIRLGYFLNEWKDSGIVPDMAKISVVGNVFNRGNDTGSDLELVKGNGYVYAANNNSFDPKNEKIVNNEVTELRERPVWLEGLKAVPSGNVIQSAIKNVGARPAMRDSIDQRIINGFLQKTGKIIDSQSEVGGYPNYRSAYRAIDIPKENISEWLEKQEQSVL